MLNVFCNIYERLILNKIQEIFNFNSCQYGYTRWSSCKHASFLVNETISYIKKGGSPCYVISLDLRKAFDRVWRQGIFHKLHGKIDNAIWRALFKYYNSSVAFVQHNGTRSESFVSTQCVKVVFCRHTFLNFLLDDMINKCVDENVGAKIGDFNLSIISYCDDLLITYFTR